MGYVEKLYIKKQNYVNEYLKFKTEVEKFKRVHRDTQSLYSYNTKYFCEEKLKELENNLIKNKLSVQRVKNLFTKMKNNSKKYNNLEKTIIENFMKNFENTKSYFKYQKTIETKWCERRNKERDSRSFRASKEFKAQFLLPHIENFVRKQLVKKLPNEAPQIVENVVKRVFETEYLNYYLIEFKKKYGDTSTAYKYFKNRELNGKRTFNA